MKTVMLIVSAVGLFAVPATNVMAQSAAHSVTSGTPLSPRTAAVLRTVMSSNLFEIESSRLAQTRSQSSAVRDFADHMVKHHTRAANRTRQVLADIGASPPPAMLEPAHQQQLDALKAVANQPFDSAFIEAQYVAHVEAIALLRDYAATGDNERLKSLAAQALAMLQGHLDQVTRLRDDATAR